MLWALKGGVGEEEEEEAAAAAVTFQVIYLCDKDVAIMQLWVE